MITQSANIQEQLRTLREFTAIINSTLDLHDLMNIVMERAKSELGAEACSILFYNPQTNKLEFEVAICDDEDTCEILKKKIEIEVGQGIAGWVALHKEPLYIEDVSKDERFYSGVDKTTGFVTRAIIAVPLIGRTGLIGVAEIINPTMKNYDKDIFLNLCKQFAIAIENALLYKESLEREKIRQQIEIASQIQKSFLPSDSRFEKGDFLISATNIPAYTVGGDLYDFVDYPNSKGGVFIGDISGKGVSAALYMAKLISDFRHISVSHKKLTHVMSSLNALIMKAPMGMFLTAIYIVFDSKNGRINYINAGHPPFVLVRTTGDVKVIDDISGPPLGIIDYEYKRSSMILNKGDRLYLLTDGVIDMVDMKGKNLGYDKITDFFVKNHALKDLFGGFLAFIEDFGKGQQRNDDITVVEIMRR
ncbi:MAG: SpoIIE family protein phosphatase [Thermodesulfovibrionales bacterium]|nr:SpoIIE family protein phosphatase [Thermodesulfovibrionales bacterium]